MPSGSPTSDKYVVYTVETETDESCSSLAEDGHIVFKDPDCISLHEKEKESFKQIAAARSFSTSSSTKWGSYWTKRERCCCVWNLFLLITVVALATVFVLVHKNILKLSPPPLSNSTPEATSELVAVGTTTTPSAITQRPRQTCTSPDCVRLAAEVLSRMNTAADPCEDFYEYSCGGYIKDTFLSWERPRIRENPDVVNDKYNAYLKDSFSSPHLLSSSKVVKVIKEFYLSCINQEILTKKYYQEYFQTMVEEFQKEDLNRLLMRSVFEFGASPFFKILTKPDGTICIINHFSDNIISELLEIGEIIPSFKYLMPSDLYYRFKGTDKVIQSYKSFVTDTLTTLLGNNTTNNTDALINSLKDVFEFEVFINQMWYKQGLNSISKEINNCDNKMNISQLQSQFSGYNIPWLSFLQFGVDKNITESYQLCHVDLSDEVAYIIANTNKEVLRNYVIIHTLLNTNLHAILADKLPIFHVSTSIYNKYKHTVVNSEQFCVDIIKILIPVPSIFVSGERQAFTVQTQFLKIILKEVLQETISNLYWIPSKQRNGLKNHITDIDISFDWSAWNNSTFNDSLLKLNISTDFLTNAKQLIMLRNKWYLKGYNIKNLPPSALSEFNEWNKIIGISASALHSPVFYRSSTIPVMYGSLGALIAQALAQAFDINTLMQHLMNGIIDQRVAYTLAHHLQCLIDKYNLYFMEDQSGKMHNVRGDLTKGENFRDILALLITHTAYKRAFNKSNERIDLPGVNFTDDQLFYITYSQTFCEKINSRGMELYYIGENNNRHMPRKYRIQGTLSNYEDFSKSFKCKKQSTFNPSDRCNLF